MIVCIRAYIYARRACDGREKNVFSSNNPFGTADTRRIRQLLDIMLHTQSEPSLEVSETPQTVVEDGALTGPEDESLLFQFSNKNR